MIAERLDAAPARWYTLLGVVLVPILVAGGFLLAGVGADGRLQTVQAAVVNSDEPVTIEGQYTPLGRQLTANLVDSDRVENLTWVLASEGDARAGLATGAYAAMVLIPENFSAAATSFAEDADEAGQATIQVRTSPVAGVADATLGRVVANEAASTLNSMLTEGYLDQIYIGFNDLGDQFVTMADGSGQLADGAADLADGVEQAADGSAELHGGARRLSNGLGTLADETGALPRKVRALANGVADYVDGVDQLVEGSVSGQRELIATVSRFEAGADQLGSGLGDLGSSAELLEAAAAAAQQAAAQVPCPDFGVDAATQAAMCQAFAAGLDGGAELGLNVGVNAAAAASEQAVGQFTAGLTQFREGLEAAAGDATTAAQVAAITTGGKKLAAGTDQLADQFPELVDGIAQLADGAGQLTDGVDQLGAGLDTAADGSGELADGLRELADGIAEGRDKLPAYTKADRESLATAVAAPVDTSSLTGLATPHVGWISLVLVLALWLGALATYSVVRAVGAGLLNSAEPIAVLIARALLPGLVVVSAQAVVVAALSRFGLDLSGQQWLETTGLLLLAGVTFVTLTHALVAWFGGLGRLVSVGLAVLAAASTLTGAAPAAFGALRPFSPLTPALDAVRAIATESSGTTIAALTLVGWLLAGFTASAVAVARRRTTTLEAVLAGA